MTSELYEYDLFGNKTKSTIQKNKSNELNWLINEIIKPELPNLIDRVENCLQLLNSNEICRMPLTNNGDITSPSAPQIEGIMSRQGKYILDIRFTIKFLQFRKGKPILFQIDRTSEPMEKPSKFPLPQLQIIDEKLNDILQSLEDIELIEDNEKFIRLFNTALVTLTQMMNILQNPPNNINFPFDNNNILRHFFPHNYNLLCESIHHFLSLEIVLVKNQLVFDFRNLDKIIKKPWCDIDPITGRSMVDKIRDLQKIQRNSNLEEILAVVGVQVEEPNLINNILLSTFKRESTTIKQAQFYLSRCITFDGKIVAECEKLSTTCTDHLLISLEKELSILEDLIGNHFKNLTI